MSSSAASNQRLFIDASSTSDPQSASTNTTNNISNSTSQQQQGDTPTSARTQNTSLYADDDSAVSSEVTEDDNSDPEVPILTRMEVVREEEVLPRNRKEWCIVLLAILCILLIAAGVGVGVYFLVRHLTNDDDSDKSVPPPVVTNSPTGSPTSMPTNGTLPQPMPGLPSDLGGAIQLHVLQQGISNLLSFGEPPDNTTITDDNIGDGDINEGSETPQELAIDYLVSKDTLPVEVLDAKNDEGNTDDVFGSTSNKDVLVTRPYITIDTPAYRVAQRYAALVLYHGTNGNEWSSNNRWLEPGVHECDWVGVTCELVEIPSMSLKDALVNPTDLPTTTDDSSSNNMDVTMERMITSIDLPKNNLQGNIPQELVALPYLERLGLWSNELTGQIPSSIGKLSRLSSVLLDDNDLSGSIPHELGDLNELSTLFLGLNKDITGRIPNSIHNLSNLQKLGLNDLSLSGPIPKKFGQLLNLTWLDLSKNELTNTLPNELSKVTSLQTLLVNDNELSGSIPESYGERLVNLERFEVHGNDLSGSVDSSLCELTTVGSLETLVATDCNSNEGGGSNTISCDCCTSCV